MILELDCGNTLIKWRVLNPKTHKATSVQAIRGIEELLPQVTQQDILLTSLDWGRLVSVRSDEETQAIIQAMHQQLGIAMAVAKPAAQLAGVTNGYQEPQRLGMDRWLAVLGAYHHTQGPCLVIDLGTAVTVDWVDQQGQHLGGFITPGLPMLRTQLQLHTRRVRYSVEEAQQALHSLEPGTSTGQAVERGCLLMLRAYIEKQIGSAQAQLGAKCSILVTGGDLEIVADLPAVQSVPDLVFQGLAIACPYPFSINA